MPRPLALMVALARRSLAGNRLRTPPDTGDSPLNIPDSRSIADSLLEVPAISLLPTTY